MGKKLIKAAESAVFELQSKYEGLKILLYNNLERNQYEIIVDVEKYGLDDAFVSDLARTVREKTILKVLGFILILLMILMKRRERRKI